MVVGNLLLSAFDVVIVVAVASECNFCFASFATIVSVVDLELPLEVAAKCVNADDIFKIANAKIIILILAPIGGADCRYK